MLLFISNQLILEQQRVRGRFHFYILPARNDLMPSMLLVPLGQCRGHMHLFDNVPPTHASVVSTEGNLALLRGIRNNALLGPPEIVVEQILKPHPRDEQEIPPVLPPLHHIVDRPVRTNFSVILPGSVEVL